MTGKLLYLGPEPDRAAGFKLAGNLALITMMSGVFDCSLAKSLGIPAAEAITLFDWFNVGALLPARAKGLLTFDFTKPSFELAMARKDVRLMMEAAKDAGIELAMVPAVAAKMDAWIQKGHGNDDWTVIATDAR